jgi:predicted amidohydrolase
MTSEAAATGYNELERLAMRIVLVQPLLRHAADADNVAAVLEALESSAVTCQPDDVLLLPERFHLSNSRDRYLADVQRIARAVGCSVVGGSHHEQRGSGQVNAGVVVDATGSVIGAYEKVRPYHAERMVVSAGSPMGEITIGGHAALVLVCADFWYSDLIFRAQSLPDLVLVPALSVSRKPAPDFSRQLWRHLAVARAYELGAYVGVSDWAHDSELPLLRASGVGGFADPTAVEPEQLFRPLPSRGAAAFSLDFVALSAFRRDRAERGFFWKADG